MLHSAASRLASTARSPAAQFICLSLLLSVGVLLVVLSSVLDNSWWIYLTLPLYLLLLPCQSASVGRPDEWMWSDPPGISPAAARFLVGSISTTIISSPVILLHANLISWPSTCLSAVGSILIIAGVSLYRLLFHSADSL